MTNTHVKPAHNTTTNNAVLYNHINFYDSNIIEKTRHDATQRSCRLPVATQMEPGPRMSLVLRPPLCGRVAPLTFSCHTYFTLSDISVIYIYIYMSRHKFLPRELQAYSARAGPACPLHPSGVRGGGGRAWAADPAGRARLPRQPLSPPHRLPRLLSA